VYIKIGEYMKKIVLLIALGLMFGHDNHLHSHGSKGQGYYEHTHQHSSHRHTHANYHHNNEYHSKHIYWGNLLAIYDVDEHPFWDSQKIYYWRGEYDGAVTDLHLLYNDFKEVLKKYDDLLEENDELKKALINAVNGEE
jgi:hypothetical protein